MALKPFHSQSLGCFSWPASYAGQALSRHIIESKGIISQDLKQTVPKSNYIRYIELFVGSIFSFSSMKTSTMESAILERLVTVLI